MPGSHKGEYVVLSGLSGVRLWVGMKPFALLDIDLGYTHKKHTVIHIQTCNVKTVVLAMMSCNCASTLQLVFVPWGRCAGQWCKHVNIDTFL